jgi:hypothetical protein
MERKRGLGLQLQTNYPQAICFSSPRTDGDSCSSKSETGRRPLFARESGKLFVYTAGVLPLAPRKHNGPCSRAGRFYFRAFQGGNGGSVSGCLPPRRNCISIPDVLQSLLYDDNVLKPVLFYCHVVKLQGMEMADTLNTSKGAML